MNGGNRASGAAGRHLGRGPRAALAVVVLVIVGCCLAARPVLAQEPVSGAAQPLFRAAADVVLLDAVVRDRRGRLVRDLKASEIEIYEDDVRQGIVQFRFYEGGVSIAGEGPGDAATPAAARDALSHPVSQSLRHPNLVTLVFDQLGQQSRLIARKAALDFLKLQDRPDVYISVFQIGQNLRLLQQFTADRAPLRDAVTRATGEVATQYPSGTDDLARAVESAERARDQLDAAESIAVSGPEGAATVAGLAREAAMADFVVNALRMTRTLQNEQQGTASLYALLSLAKKQQVLSGRKTILYFSEGLQAPPNLEHVLKTAISEANRANVSIYAVDARGLLTDSDMHLSRDMLQDAVTTSQRQNMSRGGRAVTREEATIADTAEAAIRGNTQATLEDLAQSTGGVLIGNTNDVGKGIARAVGDLSGYYELSYTPQNRTYDGRFRRITIKVTRPGTTVQARSGYFAVPPGEAVIDFPFELDLLKAIRTEPRPSALPLALRVFSFGQEGRRQRFTLVAELPMAEIRTVAGSAGQESAHVSFLALVRDPTGAVVEKFSEDTPVLVPKDRLDSLRQGSATYVRTFTLPLGAYRLEAAAEDRLAHLHGVVVDVVESGPAEGVTLSTPAFVKRLEEVTPGALGSRDPFRIGETRIIPFVRAPQVDGGELPLYVIVYPGPGEAPKDILLEFTRDGKPSGRSRVALPAADTSGRIALLAPIPVARFAPGAYVVRMTVQQGQHAAESQLAFSVVRGAPGDPR